MNYSLGFMGTAVLEIKNVVIATTWLNMPHCQFYFVILIYCSSEIRDKINSILPMGLIEAGCGLTVTNIAIF